MSLRHTISGHSDQDRLPSWVDVERCDDRIRIRCRGCDFVDAEHVQRLHQFLSRMMQRNVRLVELDLRDVKAADTKLAAGLVLAVRLARRCGVELVIHMPGFMRDIIRICRLDAILPISADPPVGGTGAPGRPRRSGGVCTLRREDVRRILEREFGAKSSLDGVYDLPARPGHSCPAPRPKHEKNDPHTQRMALQNLKAPGLPSRGFPSAPRSLT